MRKKKILFLSNYHRRYTGFAKNLKNVLCHLYKTGNYEIVEGANGIVRGDKANEETSPWKVIGTLPNEPKRLEQLNKDPALAQRASYGHETIDQIIAEEKPDIFVGIEDYWGFSGFVKRPWWNKINCMIWTTLDSLPILHEAVQDAPEVKHFYSWASFASTELNNMGHKHVGHLRGALSNDNFYKLDGDKVRLLRKKFNIDDSFITGFVFRNQLRKTVPALLDGLKIIKNENPDSNVKVFLHTNWREGWDIPALIAERSIAAEDVLTTYFCSNCKDYAISQFVGHDLECPSCASKGCLNTVSIEAGVYDYQLNEIYNMIDFYVHPFTSGGQEIPIQEAMMAETPTACTNYSCGSDFCNEESGGVSLSWTPYYEFPTKFIKAHTNPQAIVDAIKTSQDMSDEERERVGAKGREYILNNYSIEVVGKKLEDIFDNMPLSDYDFDFKQQSMDPFYPEPQGVENAEFVKRLYKHMLNMEVDDADGGLLHWMQRLATDLNRGDVYNYFRGVASNHNDNLKKGTFSLENMLDSDDEGRRIAVVLTEDQNSILMSSYFFEEMHEKYPNHNIYVFVSNAFANILVGNKFIHKLLPFNQIVEDISILEGGPNSKRFFEVAYIPHQDSQLLQGYAHNDLDQSSLCIK